MTLQLYLIMWESLCIKILNNNYNNNNNNNKNIYFCNIYQPSDYTLSNDSMADFINKMNKAFFDLDKRSDIILVGYFHINLLKLSDNLLFKEYL